MSREELEETAEMLDELERRDENEAAKFFEPNGKAAEFVKMVGEKGEEHPFVNMFIGANGVGKSAVGANIITNIVYGVQNKWFDYPLFQNFPYQNKRGRIISDPTTLKEKTIPELKKWFPKGDASRIPEASFEERKGGKAYTQKFITNTGWEIDLMSTEQDLKEFESVDLSWVWIDEPMPHDRFNATIFRGRAGMVVFWTLTPLFHAGWIKDWLDEHSDGKYADSVEAEIEDNCIRHGERGLLKHRDIERMAAAVPEDEQEARVFGRFGHLVGRVHKKFKRKVHVVKAFTVNEKDFAVYKALDPHPRTADHALYLAVDRQNQWFVCGEIISEGTTKEFAMRMREYEKNAHFRLEGRLIDPSAYNNDRHNDEASVGLRLEEYEAGQYIRGSKDLHSGIKALDDALDYTIQNGEWIRRPKILFMDNCPVAIKQLEEYVWQNWVGRGADEKEPKAKPRDKDDHQVENLHRLCESRPIFIPFKIGRNADVEINRRAEETEKLLDPYYSPNIL